MSRSGWIALALVTLLATGFAYANRGERLVVHLGFATFYRAPTALVVLLAFLLGMLAMFLAGLRHDLRVRRALRELATVAPQDDYSRSYTGSDLS